MPSLLKNLGHTAKLNPFTTFVDYKNGRTFWMLKNHEQNEFFNESGALARTIFIAVSESA